MTDLITGKTVGSVLACWMGVSSKLFLQSRRKKYGVSFLYGRHYSMKESNLNSSSKTNWERIDAMTDDEIDVSDSPPLSEDFFAKAKWLMPGESASRQTVKVELEQGPN